MLKSPFKWLSHFPRTFPAFTYSSGRPAELGLRRLLGTRKSPKSSPEFKEAYKRFTWASDAETNTPLYKFFFNGYKGFDYNSRASPKSEFERLRVHEKWKATDRQYERAKRLFEEAFEKEFGSELDMFFRRFKNFRYNPWASPKLEFIRLVEEMRWDLNGNVYKDARRGFFNAFANEFDSHFGVDGEHITAWQFLCEVLGVPPPETIDGCMEVSISRIKPRNLIAAVLYNSLG